MRQPIDSIKAATAIIGDKWNPELLRYFLASDTVRFCQLQEVCSKINPRTLSARLTYLEKNGIITRIPTTTSRCEYAITAKGKDLLPILQSMGEWSKKYDF